METFAEWVIKRHQEIVECGKIVTQRIKPGENLYAMYLEELFDISGIALKLFEEATEYHNIKVKEITDNLVVVDPTGNKKTQLDYAKNYPCDELTVLNKIKTLNSTIQLRTLQGQSLIKFYCK